MSMNNAFAAQIGQAGGQRESGRPFDGTNTEQRFRCLDLAVRAGHSDPTKLAAEFYDFATGKTVVERVGEAIAKADIG